MKRIILSLLTITLPAFGGLATDTAHAQGPHGSYRRYANAPQVVIYRVGGGYAAGNGIGYGGAYGGGYGSGYAPYVAPYYPPSAPYGAGYSSGYQPFQQMYLQRLYYGLGY